MQFATACRIIANTTCLMVKDINILTVSNANSDRIVTASRKISKVIFAALLTDLQIGVSVQLG
jgi:hypothetical protein